MKTPFLHAQNIHKSVATASTTTNILSNVTLSVERGQSAAIVGTSGSGKTTLLGLLAGLDTPDSGKIQIDGTTINTLGENQRAIVRRQKIGFVFQSFQLLPGLTALENVQLALQVARTPSLQRAQEYLERVELGHRLHHYPAQLSGGEQQRVAIARAFANNSQLLFADEPTGNLDKKTGSLISDILFSMNKELGSTLVLVTHDQKLAKNCQLAFKLEAGKCEQTR